MRLLESMKFLVILYSRKWIKKYNSHRELKDTGKGMSESMTKGRKTTWEERIQIVLIA